jgi:hypothetical protein
MLITALKQIPSCMHMAKTNLVTKLHWTAIIFFFPIKVVYMLTVVCHREKSFVALLILACVLKGTLTDFLLCAGW